MMNSTLKNIYSKAIENKLAYDLTLLKHHREIGVGSSKPVFYSNCESLDWTNSDCLTYTKQSCQSFVVKKGIGLNHEFIDSPLAGLFLGEGKIKVFVTRYSQDGYDALYHTAITSADKISIAGTVSPLICGFKSFTDIIKSYQLHNNAAININSEGFHQSEYLNKLRDYFAETNPQSIADYFISQYVSGGGDPNPGNIGFAENYPVNDGKYKYVMAKVDLGASFKNYSSISGSKPTLTHNKYAFYIPTNIKNLQQLYEYIIKDGNILMPGPAYDCERKAHKCQWSGQGNIGLHNGQYMNSGDYGINMGNYIKKQHLQNSLIKLCDIAKDDIIGLFKASAVKIHELLHNSQENASIPVINSGVEAFGQYISERADFIGSRYEDICGFIEKSGAVIDDNQADAVYNEPLSYSMFAYHNPDLHSNILVASLVTFGAIGVAYCLLG